MMPEPCWEKQPGRHAIRLLEGPIMERVIYKFPLELRDEPQVIGVPKGTLTVHAGMQDGKPTLWMEVPNPTHTQKLRHRKFRIFGTGHTIPTGYLYVGTCVGNPFVWHIYELVERTD